MQRDPRLPPGPTPDPMLPAPTLPGQPSPTGPLLRTPTPRAPMPHVLKPRETTLVRKPPVTTRTIPVMNRDPKRGTKPQVVTIHSAAARGGEHTARGGDAHGRPAARNASFNHGENLHGGHRIADSRFHSSFGHDHQFHIGHPTMIGGQASFQFGGTWFGIVDPWPAAWLYTDAVYVDFVAGEYVLMNVAHPEVTVAVSAGDAAPASCATDTVATPVATPVVAAPVVAAPVVAVAVPVYPDSHVGLLAALLAITVFGSPESCHCFIALPMQSGSAFFLFPAKAPSRSNYAFPSRFGTRSFPLSDQGAIRC